MSYCLIVLLAFIVKRCRFMGNLKALGLLTALYSERAIIIVIFRLKVLWSYCNASNYL